VLQLCLLAWLFFGVLSWAQNAPEQPGVGSGMGQDQAPGTGMMGMHHRHDMSKMHEQMMTDMQGDLDSMRSNLQKMKDQISKVSDRGTRDRLQLNIDMWPSFVDHMDRHMDAMKQTMSAHHGPPGRCGQTRTSARSGASQAVTAGIRRGRACFAPWPSGLDQYNHGARSDLITQAG
jgi:hypothetical protein